MVYSCGISAILWGSKNAVPLLTTVKGMGSRSAIYGQSKIYSVLFWYIASFRKASGAPFFQSLYLLSMQVRLRKLAPRRDGPWTIVQKLPNGVNFQIENRKKEQKVVHHDRLLPVKTDQIIIDHPAEIPEDEQIPVSDSEFSDDPLSSSASASEHSYSDDEENSDDNVSIGDIPARNYPRRDRRTRTLPGAIPWNAIRI
eukprot:gene14851-biopygen11943